MRGVSSRQLVTGQEKHSGRADRIMCSRASSSIFVVASWTWDSSASAVSQRVSSREVFEMGFDGFFSSLLQ